MGRLHRDAEERARGKIARSPFADQAEAILWNARPLIRLDPARGRGAARRSWLGGQPALPEDIDWPTWDPTEPLTQWIVRREHKIAEYQHREFMVTPTGTISALIRESGCARRSSGCAAA